MVSNQQKITSLMKTPSSVTWEDITWLDNLSKEYPYFQTARTLIARHYLKENHLLKTQKVHSASAYAINRRQLKQKLYELEPQVSENNVTEEVKVHPNTAPENIEAKTSSLETVAEQVTSQEVETAPVVKKIEKDKNDLLEAINNRLDELSKSKPDSLIEEVLSDKVETTEEIDQVTEPKEIEESKELKEAIKLEEINIVEEVKDFQIETSKEDPTPVKKTRKKKIVAKDNTEELKKEITESIKPKEIFYSRLGNVLHSDSNENLDLLIDYLNDQKVKRTEKEIPQIIKPKKDIISNFIKAEPKIKKLEKVQFIPTEDMSEIPSKTNIKLISENLAKINVKQGNIKEAKEIYKALMLKFPEKKSYFATQIKKLK